MHIDTDTKNREERKIDLKVCPLGSIRYVVVVLINMSDRWWLRQRWIFWISLIRWIRCWLNRILSRRSSMFHIMFNSFFPGFMFDTFGKMKKSDVYSHDFFIFWWHKHFLERNNVTFLRNIIIINTTEKRRERKVSNNHTCEEKIYSETWAKINWPGLSFDRTWP